MEATDQELVKRFREGDERAAKELYGRHVETMLEMVGRKLRDVSSRGWYDSEGIVNSGFRSFFSQVKKPNFDPDTWRVAALLTTIVQRKFLVQARRKAAPRGHDPEDLRLIAENAVAMSADAASMQEAETCVNEVIAAALEETTDLDRSILQRWLDKDIERTLDDIADECGCSLSGVKGCLKRFESRLRELLAEGESDRT
jgi:DNA-directed RNA polymerase specialized sigma24 family protein